MKLLSISLNHSQPIYTKFDLKVLTYIYLKKNLNQILLKCNLKKSEDNNINSCFLVSAQNLKKKKICLSLWFFQN